MKNLYPLAFAAAVAACASTPPAALKPLDFKMPCLGYPMHALRAVAVDATPEDKAKADEESYAFSFEDADGQREYVECLEKDPKSEDYGKYHENAVRWMKEAQSRRDRYAAALPEGRRIARVKTTFADVDDKRSKMMTEIVRNDGSRVVRETVFDKLPR